MNREFEITAPRTYATKENVRKAIAKYPYDWNIRHTILQDDKGRFFPVFFPSENELSETGIHFRWNVIRG